ncbi:ABC transporter permease [Rickettsiales endosymbiont of Paramecium tredecaurelia]|uniref:ABC transporter permease n=1 Tax=Candidatus Sarmatiella mevalonica TaxID=2770581 RepID=UPI0019217A1B|nr:ABC transporter permease subunit [Candidatus Sarmatiella mevalonica]MBL3284252.1 ABC transporter permease [Candidatus Sarmatiella mevalonica]
MYNAFKYQNDAGSSFDVSRYKTFVLYALSFSLLSVFFLATGAFLIESNKQIYVLKETPIFFDFYHLFVYSFKTFSRMFIAMVSSLIFSLLYALVAAKSKRMEMILIPLLDILQSVPILGYTTFAVSACLSLFSQSMLSIEMASIFAIFTSQVWNITYSMYNSFKTIPIDLIECSKILKLSKWQKFWKLELPYAVPDAVFNITVSLSSGWFFVVAAESIEIAGDSFRLPGIGSYIAAALDVGDSGAILYAVLAMCGVILAYDQLLIRPLRFFAQKFSRSNESPETKPWVSELLQSTIFNKNVRRKISCYARKFVFAKCIYYGGVTYNTNQNGEKESKCVDYIWYALIALGGVYLIYYFFTFFLRFSTTDIMQVLILNCITLLRIILLLILASFIWLPIGVWIGLSAKYSAIAQTLSQFLAAFPVNILFPLTVIMINKYHLNTNIFLSFLMIMGAQWYILFNVIAGIKALPKELKEASDIFKIRGLLWWRKVALPQVMPQFIVGLIAAAGGAWNASIVAEYVNFKDQIVEATGIGAYITHMTIDGDFERLALGIAFMSLFVVTINRCVWKPLYFKYLFKD